MASEGNGVPATGVLQFDEYESKRAECGYNSEDLSRKYDTHLGVFVKESEIRENSGEYKEKYNGTW